MSLRSRSHVGIHGFNESRSFIYIQLYKITFNNKIRLKTHFIKLINCPEEA